MRYVSTRSAGFGLLPPQPFSAILLEGLAPDGGLAVPESYPRFTPAELAALRPLDYRQLAFAVLSRYADDIPAADLQAIIARTYTAETFGSDEIAPLLALEPDLFLLRVSNGPTLAFKDIALQLLANLFEYVLAKQHATLNILGATSGDTGSSAELAMRGKRGLSVFMLSPKGKMSPFQTAQMYSLTDANIFNIAIDGVFDDCQDIVKSLAGDAAFKAKHRIGAVNSINWARVAAQLVYYFKACFAVGGEVSFAVPSGNFGNVYAGHVAREMGLPIRKLIVATNENDVLDEFFRSGRYRVRRAAETLQTSSPSMDISKASNFERFVFDLTDRDAVAVAALWRDVEARGGFDLAGTPFGRRLRDAGFVSGRSTHADRLKTIRMLAERYDVVVDPHTADGVKVGLERREAGVPLICIETALPAKFSTTIREALGYEPKRPPAYEDLEVLPQRFVTLPADVAAVKSFVARHAHA
ncbi:MAG: threonine synthase [Betaproteobacteria bacterium]|nr:MAG: threonine synthase [Betaproteobacteria bacterium]